MGLITRVLSFTRAVRNSAKVSDTKANPGGGPNITAEHFAPPGDDSHPLASDYAYVAPTAQRGRYAAVGYVDPKSEPKARPGEKRIYARDESGAVVCEVWLKADGSGTLVNSQGSVTLAPDGATTITGPGGSVTHAADGSTAAQNPKGSVTLSASGSILGQNTAGGSFELGGTTGDFVVNGVTIAKNGAVTIPTSLTLNGKEIAGHTHAQGNDSAGNVEQNTGPNL